MTTLSDRTRPDIECPRWVYEEILKLEQERDSLAAQAEELRDLAEFWINQGMPGPHPTKEEYNTWLALGHHSNALRQAPVSSYERLVRRAVREERNRCLAIAQENMDRLPNYDPNSEKDLEDQVEQGYGNACLNIKLAIQQGQEAQGSK